MASFLSYVNLQKNVLVAVFLIGALFQDAIGADYFLDKVDTTPDYCQTDSAFGGLPSGGVSCGSVSASNAVMWLANNGWSNLAPSSDDPKYDQYLVALDLASSDYMKTIEYAGTDPTRLCHGFAKYITDAGYDYVNIEMRGWRGLTSGTKISKTSMLTDLDWARSSIEAPNTVQLWSVGWYNYHADTNSYSRDGGHWVSMVGYGRASDDPEDLDPDTFIIHDPAPRTGISYTNNYVQTTPIPGGTIGSSVQASDYYFLSGWPINSVGTCAILDAIITIELAMPGDANADGVVDGSDATILAGSWQHGVGMAVPDATWSMGDFNLDGVVDGSDATILAGHWQFGYDAADSSFQTVPEPGSLALLLAGSLFLTFAIWRRK